LAAAFAAVVKAGRRLGLRFCQAIALRFIPTQNLRHILSALRLLRKRFSGPSERYAAYALQLSIKIIKKVLT
jgi:hypothetical protein